MGINFNKLKKHERNHFIISILLSLILISIALYYIIKKDLMGGPIIFILSIIQIIFTCRDYKKYKKRNKK